MRGNAFFRTTYGFYDTVIVRNSTNTICRAMHITINNNTINQFGMFSEVNSKILQLAWLGVNSISIKFHCSVVYLVINV